MGRTLGRKLSLDKLIPLGLVRGTLVLRAFGPLVAHNGTVGIGPEPRLVVGAEHTNRQETTEKRQESHRWMILCTWFQVLRTKRASASERDLDLRQQGFDFRLSLGTELRLDRIDP